MTDIFEGVLFNYSNQKYKKNSFDLSEVSKQGTLGKTLKFYLFYLDTLLFLL